LDPDSATAWIWIQIQQNTWIRIWVRIHWIWNRKTAEKDRKVAMGRRGQREVGEAEKTAETDAERRLKGKEGRGGGLNGGQCFGSRSVSGLQIQWGLWTWIRI
jgi:hypothetical protein